MSINFVTLRYNEDHIKYQNRVIERGCWQCCTNCNNWNKGCNLAGNALPPPEVIVVGCSKYEYNVPF